MSRMFAAAALIVLTACAAEKEHPTIKAVDSLAAKNPGSVVQPGAGDEWGELPFRITAVHDRQKLLDAPPWHAAGGRWIFIECRAASGASFLLGIDTGGESASKKGVVLPLGDANAFLRTFASSFNTTVPPPPPRGQPVRPMLASAIVLGTNQKRAPKGGFNGGGSWITTKWFFEQYGRYAEVFVNFSFDEERGEVSEKDPDYRDHLIRQLAWAVRDGAPLPRTPADDPRLTESGPKFVNLHRLASTGPHLVAFDSPALAHYAVRNALGESQLIGIRPDMPLAPIELHRTLRGITGVSCRDVEMLRCAIVEVDASSKHFYSSNDPKQLLVVDRGAKPVAVSGPWDVTSISLADGALSPDGRYIALGASMKQQKKNLSAVYVHDLQRKETKLFQLKGEDLTFVSWDGSSLTLESGAAWDEKSPRARYRPTPAGGLEKVETLSHAVVWDASHQRSFLIEIEKALRIGNQRFVFHPDDTSSVTEECCQWAGDQILFNGDRPAFINPRTLKMKYPAAPELRGGTAHLSPDFQHVLYETSDDLWFGAVEGIVARDHTTN